MGVIFFCFCFCFVFVFLLKGRIFFCLAFCIFSAECFAGGKKKKMTLDFFSHVETVSLKKIKNRVANKGGILDFCFFRVFLVCKIMIMKVGGKKKERWKQKKIVSSRDVRSLFFIGCFVFLIFD